MRGGERSQGAGGHCIDAKNLRVISISNSESMEQTTAPESRADEDETGDGSPTASSRGEIWWRQWRDGCKSRLQFPSPISLAGAPPALSSRLRPSGRPERH